jgi:hypothetical protein
MSTEVIGRVVATELRPSTPHEFRFWTAPQSVIGIGSIVRVDADDRTVFGVVTEAFAYADLARSLDAVIGADGDPARAGDEPTLRPEIRLWTAAVRPPASESPPASCSGSIRPAPLAAALRP